MPGGAEVVVAAVAVGDDDLEFAQGADGGAGFEGEVGGGGDPLALAGEFVVAGFVDGGDEGFEAGEEVGGSAVGDEDGLQGAGDGDEVAGAAEEFDVDLQVGGAHLGGDVGVGALVEDAGDFGELAHFVAQGVGELLAILGGAEHGGAAVALVGGGAFDGGDAGLEFGDESEGEGVVDGVIVDELEGAPERVERSADVSIHRYDAFKHDYAEKGKLFLGFRASIRSGAG